ncbi:dynamin family protein [Limisphaera sp. VF-2]|uniref:dynamin family protein n=1 Tax=Limisphaera sp. VF-2 TaxID=3400418 RepID=UPI003C1BFFB4
MTSPNHILEQLARIANECRLTSLQPQIRACRQLLAQPGTIEVVVLGRFKAGKSSFLNHLVGRAILPVGVVPLTAVVTRLRAGPADRASVQFLDGTRREIPLAEISGYVGEQENPGNRKQVAAVEVELPELLPFAPLQFVDTPGLGSALRHNTEAALNFLPHIGAALVAIPADAPLSEHDLALLQEVRRHTPWIALLLTRADLLTETQRAQVLAFVQQRLSGTQNDGMPVFFYSIRSDEAAFKARLMNQWIRPLLQHHTAAGDQIVRHKLTSLRDQILNYLHVALASATRADSARNALRDRLAEERRQFEWFRTELTLFVRTLAAGSLENYLRQLRPVQRTLQHRVTRELQEQFAHWHLRLPPLLDAWRRWLYEFLQSELTELSRTERPRFCTPLQQAQAHLTRMLQALHDRLAAHVRAALDLALAPREFIVEVRAPESPPVDVAYAFDPAFATLGWLIPMRLFRRPIQRSLLARARYEVEKNLSRLAADWAERIAAALESMARQAEALAREDLETLERMVSHASSDVPRLRQWIAELESGEVSPPHHASPNAPDANGRVPPSKTR